MFEIIKRFPMRIRRYVLPTVLMALALGCLLVGFATLRIATYLAVDAGTAPYVHLEAFGEAMSRDEIRQAWKTQKRFWFAGWALLAASLPLAVYAVVRFRRARSE